MKKTTFRFVLICLALAHSLSFVPTSMAQLPVCDEDDREIDCAPDGSCVAEIFVELQPEIAIETILQTYGVALSDDLPELNFYLVTLRTLPGEDAEQVVDDLVSSMDADDLSIARAEPHRRLDTPEGVQLSIPDLGIQANPQDYQDQPAASTVHIVPAHERYTGAGITVAVVDTGMAFDHPVTSGQILGPGADFAGGDGTGQAQPNCVDDDMDGVMDESLHHGTFVAGLVHLVAPDARILPIRALETDGQGAAFDVARAILYAVESGADIINLSDTMLHEARSVEQAIESARDAGVVVVAAAGNRGEQIVEDLDDACKSFPAYRDEVIAVAAVDENLVKADFSNYGTEVDLSAPGVGLLSTFGALLSCEGMGGEPDFIDFAAWSGTSFAAPLVAGAAALILEKYPCLTPVEVRDLLMQTAQPDNNPELAGLMGAGVLDLDALTSALASDRCSLKAGASPGGTVLSWSPVLGASIYDVARGDVANLVVSDQVDLGPLICIAEDLAATDTELAPDAAIPGSGEVFFYLFRDDVSGGSYGDDGSGHPRVPGATDCAAND
jgi:subtilisin family serine protease